MKSFIHSFIHSLSFFNHSEIGIEGKKIIQQVKDKKYSRWVPCYLQDLTVPTIQNLYLHCLKYVRQTILGYMCVYLPWLFTCIFYAEIHFYLMCQRRNARSLEGIVLVNTLSIPRVLRPLPDKFFRAVHKALSYDNFHWDV